MRAHMQFSESMLGLVNNRKKKGNLRGLRFLHGSAILFFFCRLFSHFFLVLFISHVFHFRTVCQKVKAENSNFSVLLGINRLFPQTGKRSILPCWIQSRHFHNRYACGFLECCSKECVPYALGIGSESIPNRFMKNIEKEGKLKEPSNSFFHFQLPCFLAKHSGQNFLLTLLVLPGLKSLPQYLHSVSETGLGLSSLSRRSISALT